VAEYFAFSWLGVTSLAGNQVFGAKAAETRNTKRALSSFPVSGFRAVVAECFALSWLGAPVARRGVKRWLSCSA
jgi:hypothetical protein